MIQFNLLPDIKQEFILAKRNKHIVIVCSFIISSVAVGILILMFLGVSVFQKRHMDNLTNDINQTSKKIKETPDIDKILTIQNQLNNLDSLHNQKPVSSRFFNFTNKVTPSTITISSSTLDFVKGAVSLSGNSPDVVTLNKFVDTIKFTKYQYPELDDKGQPRLNENSEPIYTEAKNAFNSVVLTAFSITTDPETKVVKITYQIDFNFDPTIYDVTKNIELVVPQQITTRSETEKPTLYKGDKTTNPTTQ